MDVFDTTCTATTITTSISFFCLVYELYYYWRLEPRNLWEKMYSLSIWFLVSESSRILYMVFITAA